MAFPNEPVAHLLGSTGKFISPSTSNSVDLKPVIFT